MRAQHCKLTTADISDRDIKSIFPTPISSQAFTPILALLLLSPNPLVGGPARQAIVDILGKMWRTDVREEIVTSRGMEETVDGQEKDSDSGIGYFGPQERQSFQQEVLHQVVIGIGRLDDDDESEFILSEKEAIYTLVSASSSQAELYQVSETDCEHASLGRLLSTILMAAITASGMFVACFLHDVTDDPRQAPCATIRS